MKRLTQNQIVFVTGTSDSGKAVYLPRYAARILRGLIVCTQSRAISIIPTAEKIAMEMDKRSVGLNVGYIVNGQRVNGRKIMLMTDADLILKMQSDKLLKSVSVLIINDAHERSLNTDIVIAMAKKLCKERPLDFKVVLCCAPMDMTCFSEFFFGANKESDTLNIPNHTCQVIVDTKPIEESCEIHPVVVNEIVVAMDKYKSGNCLVFMPSSPEVSKVVESVRMLTIPDVVVLPLTEEISIDDLNKLSVFDRPVDKSRLVVVATDVAETCIMVPNIHIVIDTGLTKKMRYDVDLQITLLDEVHISKRSAEWRKDLAGRTAIGHCIRLYKWDSLKQKDVLPEILYSCPNLALLQLFNLECNPFQLEFVTRPKDTVIDHAVNLLTNFQYIDTNLKVTKRGSLVSQINLDPCLSNFVLTGLKYCQGVLASDVASIIDARPHSILADDLKTTDREQDVTSILEFQNDLLYLHSMYKKWIASGVWKSDKNSGSSCKHTSVKANRRIMALDDGACMECRSDYAKRNSLNNNVLNIIRIKACQIRNILLKNEESAVSDQITLEEMELIIGRCLARSFPRLIGEFLMPSHPMLGIHLINSNVRGKIASSSVFTIPRPDTEVVMPLLLIKLRTGEFVFDFISDVCLYSLELDVQSIVHKNSLYMVPCYQKIDVSHRYLVKSFKYFEKRFADGDQNCQFVVSLHDSATATLTVYAPKSCAAEIAPICDVQMKTWLQQDLELETIKECFDELFQVTVSAGMTIKDVKSVGESVELRFLDPPVENDKELLKWVSGLADLKTSDIKWCKYYSSYSKDERNLMSPYGTVVFRSNESALAVEKNCGSETVEKIFPEVCRVAVECFSETSIEELLGLHRIFLLKVIAETSFEIKREIIMKDLPLYVTEQLLERIIQDNNVPMPSSLQRTLHRGPFMHDFVLNYKTSDDCSEALEKLQRLDKVLVRESKTSHPGCIRYSSDVFKSSCIQKTTVTPAKYILKLQNASDGDKCYQIKKSRHLKVVDGSACLLVEHHKTYHLQSHSEAVARMFGVKTKWGVETKTTREVIFHKGFPSKCVEAVKMLRKIVTPMTVNFGDSEKQAMGSELHKLDKFQAWAKELAVVVQEDAIPEKLFGIKIYGEKQKQDEFMKKMAEYCTLFSERYSVINLPSSTCAVFNQGSHGEVLLSKIKNVWETTGSTLTYNRNLGAIEILVGVKVQQKPAVVINECRDAIKELLTSVHLQTSQSLQSCVYCHRTRGSPFLICGHHFCKECLEYAIEMTVCIMPVSSLRGGDISDIEKIFGSAMHCPMCQTKISVKDIVSSLKNTTLNECLNAFACLEIRKSNLPIKLCPNLNCSKALPWTGGYMTCSSCMKCVCPTCGIVNDNRHNGKSCKEYQLILEGEISIDELVKEAEDFARCHWRTQLNNQPLIVKVEANPGLKNGCRALQLYCEGFRKLGLKDLKSNTVFGWHGTTDNTIRAICNKGFNPLLRR